MYRKQFGVISSPAVACLGLHSGSASQPAAERRQSLSGPRVSDHQPSSLDPTYTQQHTTVFLQLLGKVTKQSNQVRQFASSLTATGTHMQHMGDHTMSVPNSTTRTGTDQTKSADLSETRAHTTDLPGSQTVWSGTSSGIWTLPATRQR